MKLQATNRLFVSIMGAAGMFFGQVTLVAAEGTDWERKQLHQPSEQLLEAEERGRITIYDGLNESEVDRALDEQFERIDSMMFIRTQYPLPVGGFYASGDCD